MDQLYTEVLRNLNWGDEAFVETYDLVLGTILAAHVALSMDAITSLHGGTIYSDDVQDVLRRLGSVLTVPGARTKPIRLLHASFADFVATRAFLADDTKQFALDRKAHSRRLLPLCLSVLQRVLIADIPGAGFLNKYSHMTGEELRTLPYLNIPGVEMSASGVRMLFLVRSS